MHLSSSYLTEWKVMLLLFQEVDVSRGDDAYEAAAHLSVIRNGDAAEAMARFCLKDVAHMLVGAHHHGICNKTLLVSLRDATGRKGRTWNGEKCAGCRKSGNTLIQGIKPEEQNSLSERDKE